MGGPITLNFFGLSTFMVICFCVENLYIISADSKKFDASISSPTSDTDLARMFHVNFIINEPYREDYSNSTSEQFQKLAERIKKALIDVCVSVAENPLVSVISLRKTRISNQVRVTATIGTTKTQGDELEDAISKQINGNETLGDFVTTNRKDFRFLEFGVPLRGCLPSQLTCRNGQCINNGTLKRCDNFLDCYDQSDEENCNYTSPRITLTPQRQIILHPGEDAYINCSASGDQPIEISWSLMGRDIPNSVYTKEGYISFKNIQLQDAGKYLCTAYNGAGKDEAVAEVIVNATTTEGPTTSTSTTKRPDTNTDSAVTGKPLTTASPPFTDKPTVTSTPSTVTEKPTTSSATTRIPATCPSNQFQCYDNYNCISQNLRCNGNNDCSDGSDEYNCPTLPPPTSPPETTPHGGIDCPYGMQPCRSGDKCARYCDGITECNDFSDENDCSFNPEQLDLRTNFNDRNQIVGEEVVLTCRDEGPLRAKVQWSRANGAPLPPGSNDINGSLTIPNIQLEHAGIYVCSAINFPTNSPKTKVAVTVVPNCPTGKYKDGNECQICPCPHTTPGNHFGRSCQLGPNRKVICNCPPEYVGNRCEKCAPGYVGNPLVSGDSCRRIPPPRPYCDSAGSIDSTPDQYGRCRCKNLVDGPICNQCKANSFHLNSQNQFGCVSCFCMGVSSQCSSSNWYRSQVSNIFVSSIHEFKLVGNVNREIPITEGIRLDSQDRQISYSRTSVVYYWSLPSRYQGNKLTSYGGYLRYSLRHKSIPGGQSSRKNAADVELVSKNKINLLYYNRNQTQPNPNGAQTFAVPILEQHWQRIDGQIADREHLLMVLADLEAIYIKATYFTNTQESSLISVSLDTATDQNTGSTQRAVEVEQCHCPEGYTGLSCETCDVGYTRTTSGNCKGYSNECDPVTGICLHCKDGTTGDYCDECLPGYTGDPSNGVPCTYGGTPPPCYCDPRGSISSECRGGRCSCKVNVEGDNCDRCRSGSFGLNSSSIEGCEICFCSGISSECVESNWYIEQIPYQIQNGNHGFTITDQSLRLRKTENFDINEFMNEVSYGFLPSNRETLYWSLPTAFTGNQIKSYGGNLEYSQRYTHRPSARYVPDKDVIIIGNEITIFWSNPVEQRKDIVNQVSVKLHPIENWFRRGPDYSTRASREDILTALAKIDAILIRATQSSDTVTAYLSDITLDTAVKQNTGKVKASSVEVCRCPVGYEGSSCESCDAGYYRDRYFDVSRPLGSCTKCPCNDNEESCELRSDHNVNVTCRCKPEFTGSNCEFEEQREQKPRVDVSKPYVDVNEGLPVEIQCVGSGVPTPDVSIVRADGQQLSPEQRFKNGVFHIRQSRLSDSGDYICIASNRVGSSTARFTITVHEVQGPILQVNISPSNFTGTPGDTVMLRCSSSSYEQNIKWSKQGGNLPYNSVRSVRINWRKADGDLPSRAIDGGNGFLVITDLRVSDAGRYVCEANDRYTSAASSVDLNVGEQREQKPRVDVSKPYVDVNEGLPVQIQCVGSGVPTPDVSIVRADGQQLSPEQRFENGVFHIRQSRLSDSGDYICIASNRVGTSSERFTITVHEVQGPILQVNISPSYFTGIPGDTVMLRCSSSSYEQNIKWSRQGGNLPYNSVEDRENLIIPNASPDDSGVYICAITSTTGTRGYNRATVTITGSQEGRFPTAAVSVDKITLNQGASFEVQCNATGVPPPSVQWKRRGGQLGRNTKQVGTTLLISDATVGGVYFCVSTNVKGQAKARVVVKVKRLEAPRLEIYSSISQTVIAGNSAVLQCRAIAGIPTPTVIWSRENNLPLSSNIEEMAGGALRFTEITPSEQGEYICTANNEAGTARVSAQITVDTSPDVKLKPPLKKITERIGAGLYQECEGTGSPLPSVKWIKWDIDNCISFPVGRRLSNNKACLELPRLTKNDEGVYVCKAESRAGVVMRSLQLIVE